MLNKVNITTKKRFVVSKSMAGQGLTIQFTNKKGQTFTYDHDAVFAKNQEKLNTMECFNKYGNYTNSNNLPTWARGEDTEVAV